MKKRAFTVFGAALVLALVLAGCNQEMMDVKGHSDQANTPGKVTVTQASDKTYAVLTWDAVDNAAGYAVVAQVKGKKTTLARGESITNIGTYDGTGTFVPSTSPDIDKYTVKLTGFQTNDVYKGKEVRFGVITTGSVFSGNSQVSPSDPSWTDYFTF